MTYTTTGSIGTTGISGSPIVSFQGVTDGSLTTGMPFDLGTLVVTPPVSGPWPTYNEAPFQINFTVDTVNGSPVMSGQTSFTIGGSVYTSPGLGLIAQLDVFAPFKGSPDQEHPAVSPIIFQIGSNTLDLYPAVSLFNLGQAGSAGGPVTVQGEVDALNTPEPSTLLIFVVCGAVAIVRRARRGA
jgi:hypothetical protein